MCIQDPQSWKHDDGYRVHVYVKCGWMSMRPPNLNASVFLLSPQASICIIPRAPGGCIHRYRVILSHTCCSRWIWCGSSAQWIHEVVKLLDPRPGTTELTSGGIIAILGCQLILDVLLPCYMDFFPLVLCLRSNIDHIVSLDAWRLRPRILFLEHILPE